MKRAGMRWAVRACVGGLALVGCASSPGPGTAPTADVPAVDGRVTDGGVRDGGVADGGACNLRRPSALGPTVVPYGLPPARCATRFNALQGSGPNGAGVTWATAEFSGDRRLDLVVTADACDGAVGTAVWDVYVGGPTGFAQMATPYGLPPRRCETGYRALGGARGGGSNLSYSLLDVNQDGRSDLVVTSDMCDGAVGTAVWDVYLGGPVGFAQMPTPYGLPPRRCETGYPALAAVRGAGSNLNYSLLDMNADGRPDLVVTSDMCDGAVGRAVWDVYLGGPVGFAQMATPYGIPPRRCETGYPALAAVRGAGSNLNYSLLDMNADGRSDLVVTSDMCDGAVGTAVWDVYLGGPVGFAQTATPYGIPASRCMTNFASLFGQRPTERLSFSATSLACDRRPSLVVHGDACDDTVGADHWDVYAGEANQFAATPARITVPAARCMTRFDAAGRPQGTSSLGYVWASLEVGGTPGLIVHSDACDGAVGTAVWDLYPAR